MWFFFFLRLLLQRFWSMSFWLVLVFSGEALRPTPNPKRSCTILRGACEFPYSFAAWSWPIWEICYVRWILLLLTPFILATFFLYIFLLGGEDCNLRLWSIKSGKLLFEDKFCNTIPSTVCWRRAESTCPLLLLCSHSSCHSPHFIDL